MSRIFSLFLILFFASFAPSFATDQNPYLIENVTANFTGKSPVTARNIALSGARRDAFLALLLRLEMNPNIADKITDEEVSYMIRSEQIDGEKIAGNNYSAIMNIVFAKDFVDHVLAQKDTKAVKQKAEESYLLIPVKVSKNKKNLIWEDENDWRKAIRKILKKHPNQSSQNFVLADADEGNVSILNGGNVEISDYLKLEPLLNKYNSDAAYTLFFFYDEIENKVNINVFVIRKLQKKQIKLSFVNVDRLPYEELLEKVANKTIEYLSSSKSKEKILNSNFIHLEVSILSLENWLAIKNKIENSGLVSQLNIERISRDFVAVSVNYINTSDIAEAFFKIGFVLNKKSENFYSLTSSN